MNSYKINKKILIKNSIFPYLPKIDTLIFDIDGVLINVKNSFRKTIGKTAKFYFNNILGWQNKKELIEIKETEFFKLAGGFNDDWDLTFAVILFYLYKAEIHQTKDLDKLRELPPSLQEFTQELSKLGGGISSAKKLVLSNFSKDIQRKILHLWKMKIIKKIFQETYAGSKLVSSIYGIKPKYNFETGLIEEEKIIVHKNLFPENFKLGVITGRTDGELKAGFDKFNLKIFFDKSAILTQDSGLRKPNPLLLIKLAKMLETKVGVYIGDTLDDLRLVEFYRKKKEKPFFLSAIVLSGPKGKANKKRYILEGTDIIADDVNVLLRYLSKLCGNDKKRGTKNDRFKNLVEYFRI